MAYGLKYTLLCETIKNNFYSLKLSFDDYVGSEVDRNIPVNPFILRKDRAGIIKGTSLRFSIREETDFEFLEFYTNDPKYIKAELYKSTTCIWTGYVMPQQYSVPYISSPVTVTFTATDAMGLLKNEDFTLTGINSELTIIRYCLDKIGLSLGYAIAVDMHEINHDTAYSPLAQTYKDSEIFEGKNCYEVLENILNKYDADITQHKNRWHIIRSTCRKATRLLYNSSGTYTGTEAAAAVLDLDLPDASGVEVWPIGALNLDLEQGGKSVKIKHDYGRNGSFLKNYDFEDYSSSMFVNWTKNGTFNVYQYQLSGKYLAYLDGYANVDTNYIYGEIDVENVSGQSFVFEIDVCPLGWTTPGAGRDKQPTSLSIRIMVTLIVGATIYYLHDGTDGWNTTPGYITVTVTSSLSVATLQWTKLQIMTDELPGDGEMHVRLQQLKYAASGTYTYKAALFSEAKIYFLLNDELYPDKSELTYTFQDSSEPVKLPDITLLAADAPDYDNKSLLYKMITRLSDETPTLNWQINGSDTIYTLIQLLAKTMASRNRVARQALSGSIRGEDMTFDSVIKHAYNSNREFEVAEGEWNIYREKFTVKLLEILSWTNVIISVSDGTTLGAAADLTVYSVTPSILLLGLSEAFTATIHIDNSGGMPGRNIIEWKIVNGADVIQSSGTHASQIITASDDDDDIISLTGPAAEGTYYVKCKMASDTSWVSSAAITVLEIDVDLNRIDTIADGPASSSMIFTFEADNDGGYGSVTVYWEIYDSGNNLVDSGSQAFNMSNGIDTYEFTGVTYPATPGTGYYNKAYLSGESPIGSNTYEVTSS